ncbi:MAG TPA: condensation domain-containing protein, partial [Herpetosiphonaceae bacterium]
SLARLPQLRIWNLYGPTEATANASAGKIAATAAITIGRPIANTQAYVLDPQMQPVPIGVPGELYLGGDQVARGYNNRPVLTAARFVPDPFSGTPGARLSTTGDRVCLRPDGTIEYLGRLDQQVKLRGFRIELGEIEAVLRQHPLVHECVAIVREDEPTGAPGAKRLVAYVVEEQGNKETREQESVIDSPSPITDKAEARRGVGQGEGTPVSGGEGLTTTLRAFLQTRLPGYMIPSAFVPLAALPLMPNGKLDRAALPAPNPIRPELDTTFIAPRTWIEQTLTRIWAEVLRLEQVGIHDNFFDLGGDSILSIQIAARANQAGLPLTVKQIFAYQTVAELAEVAGTQQVVQAEQGTVSGALPLTPIQRRFFEQDHPEPHHWNQSLLLATREQLSLDLLTRVMYQILAQHDALRLRFVRTAGGWQQTNSDLTTVLPCTRLDLTALPAAEQAVAVETAAATMQSQLGLEDGALFKVVFFDLGPQRGSRLLLVVHHLVVDGVSWRILLEDLEAAYQQLSQAVPPTTAIRLPPKTTSYKQWAERLVQYAYSPALAAEWEYWREAIPAQIPPLPVDQTADRLDNREGSARSITVALDADETWTLLHEVPKVYHTQINDLLLTALALTFNQRMGLSTLLVDLEGQGREPLFDDIDVSRTVGWFTAVFPVLLCLPDVDQLGDTLTSVKEQLRRIPNRGIGYGILRYLSDQPAIAAALRAQPQAEVGFNYLGQFDHLFNADALFQPAAESSGPARSAQAKRAHLVDINAGVFEDCLRVEWLYSPAHHQHATIDALAHSFCEALRQLIAHCLGVDEGGYTPSDFAAFNWSQADLADITHSIGKLMGDS